MTQDSVQTEAETADAAGAESTAGLAAWAAAEDTAGLADAMREQLDARRDDPAALRAFLSECLTSWNELAAERLRAPLGAYGVAGAVARLEVRIEALAEGCADDPPARATLDQHRAVLTTMAAATADRREGGT